MGSQTKIQHADCLGGCPGHEQVGGGGFGADIEPESTYGTEAETFECGEQSIAEVALRESRLRAGLQLVSAQVVKLAPGRTLLSCVLRLRGRILRGPG